MSDFYAETRAIVESKASTLSKYTYDTYLTATGDLQVYVYNNVFCFTCIVKGMEEYVKENNK